MSPRPIPRAGEVYVQLGVRLFILHVSDRDVMYCCRAGKPVTVTVSLDRFLNDLDAGLPTRAEEAA